MEQAVDILPGLLLVNSSHRLSFEFSTSAQLHHDHALLGTTGHPGERGRLPCLFLLGWKTS